MAIRINWDEQEALLLFDTYEQIEKYPDRKSALISALSINLRRRAKDNGIAIDDTFRNIAGIGMRISEIDKILHPDIKGLTKTSELFRKTADLYSNHRRTFLKCVREIEEYRVKLLADLVGFDIYEAVILLDAYLSLGKNGASKAYTARLVSAKLRALAISRGCVINETYRSDTGIMGRLRKMEEAYQVDIGCADVPRVFTDAIRLFHFNRREYKKYLKKANTLIGKVVLPEDIAKKEKEKQKAKESAPVQKTKYVKTKTDRKLKEVYPKAFIAVYDALEQRWYSDPVGVSATTIYQDLKKKYPRKNIIEVLEGASWAKEIRAGKYVHALGVSFMSTQETNEKKYFSWLKKRIPLSQYSVIEKNKNAVTILLLQKRVFKKPLFLIEDAEEVSKNVNKVPPCFSNVKLKSAAIQMVTMYATYLEEMAAVQVEPQEQEIVEQTAIKTIDEILRDDLFEPLRVELSRQNIRTADELKALDLWKFMNRFNLYTIGTRQTVLTKAHALLGLTSSSDAPNGYVLHIDTEEFSGASPAETFLHFCENMSIAYPLKFRSLISIRVPGRQEMAVRKNGDRKTHLKMCNLNGYVQSDLSADTVVIFAQWICQKCEKKIDKISVETLPVHPNRSEYVNESVPSKADSPTCVSAVAQTDVSAESSATEKIKKVFIDECGNSSYGTTVTYLRAMLPGVDAKTIETVLEGASWAKKRYSRWIYCAESSTAPVVEPKPETVVVDKPAVSEMPIVNLPVQPSSAVVSPDKRVAKENTLQTKMEEIVLKADMEGMSYDALRDSMRITMAQTKQLVAESKRIVDVKGKLIHEEAFIDWEDGADALESILDKLMQKNNGYISVGQLFEYARAEMNMFLNDNDTCDERSVYDMARHLFEKEHYHDIHYSFVGNMHISRPNEKICSNLDLFKKYAADQGGVFRYSGLIEYLESLGVSTGNLRMQMRLYTESIFFNYDEDLLIFSEIMNMDEAWEKSVNDALKALFADVGDHIILRQIPGIWYDRLPALPGSRPWTPLLLQSILRFYSKEFNAHTIHAMDGQSIETLHTMLVENNSPIQNFGDVVVSCLLENEVEQRQFRAEDLRLTLVRAGILRGNELIWNMPKALKGDSRFAWDVKGENVTVMI